MTRPVGLRRPLFKAAGGEDVIRADAINDILTAGGLAAAGGITARGLLGLRYMFGRRKPNTSRMLGPTVVSVPTPVFTTPLQQQRARDRAYKAAGAATRGELPWYLPGLTLAGVGGLAGGYKLMDVLMDRKRKSDLKAEEAAAEAEYRKALLAQYDPANVPGPGVVPDVPLPAKTVNPVGAPRLSLKAAALQADLEELAAACEARAEKAAGDMPGWAGKGLGIYGTLAALLALGSGTAAYKFTKDRSTNKLMEDAIKQRERARWAARPPEVYAVPTPVRLARGGGLAEAGAPPQLLPAGG